MSYVFDVKGTPSVPSHPLFLVQSSIHNKEVQNKDPCPMLAVNGTKTPLDQENREDGFEHFAVVVLGWMAARTSVSS